MDVIVVARLGVPWRPEVTMGALGEGGARVIDDQIVETAMVSPRDVDAAERHERVRLGERATRLRGDLPPRMLGGRTAVIVDDGLASGASVRVACQVAGNRGAERIVVAVPVASEAGVRTLTPVADDVVALQIPVDFHGVGQAYLEFAPTDDDEVACLLIAADGLDTTDGPGSQSVNGSGTARAIPAKEMDFRVGETFLTGRMTVPTDARELVILAQDSSEERHSARSRYFSRKLTDAGFATLLLDLLTRDEEIYGNRYLAVPRLAERLRTVTRILQGDFDRVDYLADGVAAAIALEAAARADLDIHAVACLGGRPDLVARLGAVRAPVLLIVGEQDNAVLKLNVQSVGKFSCPYRLMTMPRAGHRFRAPGALQDVAAAVCTWFLAPGNPQCRASEASDVPGMAPAR